MDWDLLAAYIWTAGPTIHPSSFLVDEDHQNVWLLHVFNDCLSCLELLHAGWMWNIWCLPQVDGIRSMLRWIVQQSC